MSYSSLHTQILTWHLHVVSSLAFPFLFSFVERTLCKVYFLFVSRSISFLTLTSFTFIVYQRQSCGLPHLGFWKQFFTSHNSAPDRHINHHGALWCSHQTPCLWTVTESSFYFPSSSVEPLRIWYKYKKIAPLCRGGSSFPYKNLFSFLEAQNEVPQLTLKLKD